MTKLADTRAAASLVQVSPSTLHTWANRGLLTRHGRDARGRTLYDLEQVQAVAHARRKQDRPRGGLRTSADPPHGAGSGA